MSNGQTIEGLVYDGGSEKSENYRTSISFLYKNKILAGPQTAERPPKPKPNGKKFFWFFFFKKRTTSLPQSPNSRIKIATARRQERASGLIPGASIRTLPRCTIASAAPLVLASRTR